MNWGGKDSLSGVVVQTSTIKLIHLAINTYVASDGTKDAYHLYVLNGKFNLME